MFMIPGIKGFVARSLVEVHSEEFWQEFAFDHNWLRYLSFLISAKIVLKSSTAIESSREEPRVAQ